MASCIANHWSFSILEVSVDGPGVYATPEGRFFTWGGWPEVGENNAHQGNASSWWKERVPKKGRLCSLELLFFMDGPKRGKLTFY